jgi:protein TonB
MDRARETGISKMAIAVKSEKTSGRDDTLGISLLLSVAIHICAILIGSAIFHSNQLRRQEFLPIGLVDLPRPEPAPSPKRIEAPPEIEKPPPPPKSEKPKEPKPVTKREPKPAAKVEVTKPQAPPPLPAAEKTEPAKITETKPPAPAPTETPASFPSDSLVEGGGSEAGAGALFDQGDIGVIPGPGSAGGGGGTASSGLGRGSGAADLPAQTTPIKTNRQAKPIQTARATYPPMALRAGLESDVTLRIEVDSEGKVIAAEITKSGGAGFDEEALKAVKQSRFEPAQKDGRRVPAEFIYVYRFRLRR